MGVERIMDEEWREHYLVFRKIVLAIFLIILLISAWAIFIAPLIKPWQAQQKGKAELAQAEQNRQIAVKEAQARFESAKLDAQAEIERAKGVAEANRIIADGLSGHDEYLTYLWIQEISNAGHVVYVPTEANLPILEARDKDVRA